jgi:hypothetical protein
MLNILSPDPVRTCHLCGGPIIKFQLRPDVTIGGKQYLVSEVRQLPKPNDRRYSQTATIPVIYISEMQ